MTLIPARGDLLKLVSEGEKVYVGKIDNTTGHSFDCDILDADTVCIFLQASRLLDNISVFEVLTIAGIGWIYTSECIQVQTHDKMEK